MRQNRLCRLLSNDFNLCCIVNDFNDFLLKITDETSNTTRFSIVRLKMIKIFPLVINRSRECFVKFLISFPNVPPQILSQRADFSLALPSDKIVSAIDRCSIVGFLRLRTHASHAPEKAKQQLKQQPRNERREYRV